jgi:hypothetical protein
LLLRKQGFNQINPGHPPLLTPTLPPQRPNNPDPIGDNQIGAAERLSQPRIG